MSIGKHGVSTEKGTAAARQTAGADVRAVEAPGSAQWHGRARGASEDRMMYSDGDDFGTRHEANKNA